MMLAADSDNAVAVIAILVIFGAPMALWMVSKIHAHQERMAMIQRGMAPPPGRGVPPPPPGYYPGAPMTMPSPDYLYAQRQLHRGIQVACIGLALLIGLGTIGGSHHLLGPWLLGGLIPFFVGVAQIINGYLNGARLPNFGGQQQYGGPQQTYAPPPQGQQRPGTGVPPPAGSGPYGWRPGPTPEIERPVPPPDKR
jgi:hypothetical protein